MTPPADTLAFLVERQDAFLMLALTATAATIALLAVSVRDELRARPARRERRARAAAIPRDPRDALALVGDTLAATHNPDALLPVILRATADATGAAAGRLLVDGEQVAAVGDVPRRGRPLELDLGGGGGPRAATMLLYAPRRGFDEEARRLAHWLASQAAIALENAHLHHVVQRQAATDELTGLVNRRRFMCALAAEIARSSRAAPPSLILVDLDDFKLVNDTFGHLFGDRVLRWVAELIRATLRASDVPARYGGDEFAVILPDTDPDEARAAAERILAAFRDQPFIDDQRGHVPFAVSIGIATFPGDGRTGTELIAAADRALYRVKDRGGHDAAAAGEHAAA